MEILYLLCSILSTFLSSLILSVLLPFRFLLRRCGLSPAAATDSLSLYEGTVWHERRRPVHHAFRYSVRYALIGLDGACSPLPSHLSADEARRFAGSTGPVLLLTIPESVGYEQNPLSLYYCYDVEDSSKNLNKCIAESVTFCQHLLSTLVSAVPRPRPHLFLAIVTMEKNGAR
ncbi:hypothetical protein L484_021645 [Morus notabilis]|uniref:Uncharacterized protein n=1 Tax=Morus notabilis TaxID=981085 RepID=W9S6Q1_9ROSA|nr:hypothetical protein L484_021645 [Morus notabilis]